MRVTKFFSVYLSFVAFAAVTFRRLLMADIVNKYFIDKFLRYYNFTLIAN